MYDASEILKDYIGKRFSPNPKANFIAFIKEKTGIKFLEKKSYGVLFSEIDKNIGKEKFFSILGIKDIEEAEMRSCLADAFYKALVETTWLHQFSPLYERLTGERIKIKRKVEKKEPAYRLAFNVGENDFIKAWIDLYKEGVLPDIIHYKNITIGPLGWIKSLEKREKEMFGLIFGLHSEVVNIIDAKFNQESKDIIMNALLNVIEQIGKDPGKFGVSQEDGEKALKYLNQIGAENDEFIAFAKRLQLFHIYLNDENFSFILNTLIANGNIKPKVHGLYENYPYTSSDWIITPYGLFKQPSYLERAPNKALSALLQKEFEQGDLEPELEDYRGEYPLNILAYCIKENPENILDKFFGLPQLRNLAEEQGIPAAKAIKNKDELIKLILLKLAFRIPPKIVGISDYRKFLSENLVNLEKNKSIKEIMREVYIETEGLLRDLSYFYICWYGKKLRDIKSEELDELIRELSISDKPFQRLTFGEYIKLIRTLNTKIKSDKTLKNRFLTAFGRDCIIPTDQMKILDEVSPYRKPFIHPEPDEEIPMRETCLQIISKLQEFSEVIEQESVYPVVIQIKRDVTNEYGTPYYEVSDDRGDEWWIYKHRVLLDFNKSYFMYSKIKTVAIQPVIIEKVF